MCPKSNPRHTQNEPAIDRLCQFNDHGAICGQPGSMSDSTLGSGPWYCSAHYWKLKGRELKPQQPDQPSYRERWYAERNLPYQQPRKLDTETRKALAPWTAMIGRQPGEDSDTDING